MKKIFWIFCLLLFTSCSKTQNSVYVFNWGEYIDPEILKEFKKETGINVVYDTFVQNEDMFLKLKEGGNKYDVIFPSDYMVERMIDENMVKNLDHKKIPNLKYIDEDFRNLSFDKNMEHSIPYMWGTVGILYNEKYIKKKPDSWNDLWNKDYKDEIIMMDSMRDSIGISLLRNSNSLNSRNIDELNRAKDELLKQKELVLAYLVDETKSLMVNEEAYISLMYSGEAVTSIAENEHLKYVIPKEGTNIWFDNMVISEKSRNLENAYKFIDFLLRPDIMAKNGEYTGASVPEKSAKDLIDPKLRNDKVAYPDLKKIKKLEIYKNPVDFIEIYDDIWADVKAY